MLALLAACTIVAEPVLMSPASRPIPAGLYADDLEHIEVRACGSDYRGLDDLIARAQGDRDGLLQVTVDVEREFSTINGRQMAPRCYILRAYRVSFRSE